MKAIIKSIIVALFFLKIATVSAQQLLTWTNVVFPNVSGNYLEKAGNVQTAWNVGAISQEKFYGDGWVDFSTVRASNFFIGLTLNNTINYTEFNNAIQVDNNTATFGSYECSSGAGWGYWQAGDLLRISREGNLVKYSKNGSVVKSVTVAPALSLKVKIAILEPQRSCPSITSSFWTSDGVVCTYYSVAPGNWTTSSIGSLSENGLPSAVYPDTIDKVAIKGHEVIINSNIKSAGIIITSINDNTRLKVDGNMSVLTVNGNIVMNRENSTNTAEVLVVQNTGKLDVK